MWANKESKHMNFKDLRLNNRLENILEDFANATIELQNLELFLEYLNDGGDIKGEKENE